MPQKKNAATRMKTLIAAFKTKKLSVVMGGFSAERPISLKTGTGVYQALQGLGLSVGKLDIRKPRDINTLFRQKPDLAVLCLHGPFGEDGKIQGVLDWMNIRYTGCRVLASALCMDKFRAKLMLKNAGLPVAPGWLLCADNHWQVPVVARGPLVVKPNHQGSAIGVSIVKKPSELAGAIRLARRFDHEVMVEKFCPGVEITVGVLVDRVLPVIEIVPKNAFYDFAAKYTAGMSEHIIPARLTKKQTAGAQHYALAAFRTLGCSGISRIDMIVSPKGEFTILEVNTMPGMTATSLFPEAARAAGISFEQVILELMAEAMRR